ncbi:Protein kinase-like domain [Pseudocohnilembus persalinus]|uniref:non-specific serine/threonine protein kinase n=1 Tax=Pseudocohnilembus persalinus TaxID=266149 RepID=A0A0V0Q8C1_PSEPJ|nr:Protein kinase-like domain [Pseudocohnilembus persalinus]|eukprot:KRW98394.1 Protein kinase-like domain [Pseudocohnilembus persalinus]
MGACNCSNAIDQQEKISKSSYNFSYAVGQGGFGKVWKVVDKKTKEVYALKIMEKHKILTKKSVQSVINEKNILQEIQDDFIVNMKMAFQDKESLYLVLEYLDGGDLRYHLNKCYEYSEEETQFIAASIIQGLEKVHNHNIIHRDLKPENIVFSSNGQLKITDFGIARYYRPDNADQTSGTPGYMAPEVLMKCSHDFLVDYYALGVILFEIIYGERPYLGRNRKEIKQQVLQVQRYLSMDDLPDETWSLESADFVNQLIKRKPANRLGAKGIEQIKSHPWLKNFPWQNLKNGTLQNPFKPRVNYKKILKK